MLTTLASHFSHVARKPCRTMQNIVAQRLESRSYTIRFRVDEQD